MSTTMAARSVCALNPAGTASHGIGRGDFAALVFSGDPASLGDVAGHYTWNTARKFVMPDPRRPGSASGDECLPTWPHAVAAPIPGVCFVFGGEDHPAIEGILARGGVEFEHFVVLSRVTPETLASHRLNDFLGSVGDRRVAVLGYGDQGLRLSRMLLASRPESVPLIVDSDSRRCEAARISGCDPVPLGDPRLRAAAIISSPLTRPRAFRDTVESARRDGRPVLDLSLAWDGVPELRERGPLRLTPAAARSLKTDGWRIRMQGQPFPVTLSVIREDIRRLGARSVPHLLAAPAVELSEIDGEADLADPGHPAPMEHLCLSRRAAFVGVQGQSNQHDAGLGLFAARRFLREFFPDAVEDLLVSEHLRAFGATAFESMVFRSSTGRSLAGAFMTPIEQVALGIAARAAQGAVPGGAIVEIGSALGGSTQLLAAATDHLARPELISIDPDQSTRHAMRAALASEGYVDRLRQIVKLSDEAAPELAPLTGRASMVFIDGLHTHDAAREDVRNYAGLIAPGGILALHDCGPRYAGLWRVACEVASADARFEPVCLSDTLALFRRV